MRVNKVRSGEQTPGLGGGNICICGNVQRGLATDRDELPCDRAHAFIRHGDQMVSVGIDVSLENVECALLTILRRK